MPLYRMADSGKFVPFEKTPFADVEKVLEDWIESNPHLLLEGKRIAFIARQPRSEHGKRLDLIGIDETGACIVVELKRGETPRDVVAQTLEYAAWVDSLTREQIDSMARTYASQHGMDVDGVESIYRSTLAPEPEDESPDQLADRITFNNRQRLIVIAESFSPEVEQTLRYFRTRLGVDITGIQFGIHKAENETLIETNIVVGRERATAATEKSPGTRESEPHESILARAKTEFVSQAVTSIENWVKGLGVADLEVRHGSGSDHFVRYRNKTVLQYYFASNWVMCFTGPCTPEEITQLRSRLSKPNEVRQFPTYTRFHAATEADLHVIYEHVQRAIGASG